MTTTPSLVGAPADKVPLVLTALLAATGWAITHVVDRLQATPTVEYRESTEVLTTQTGERVNRLVVHLHNLSSNISFENLTFVARRAKERTDVTFFEDSEMINDAIPQAPMWISGKKALTSSTGASVVYSVAMLPPNGQVDLVAHYRGSEKPLVVGKLDEAKGPPLRLARPSIATFLLRNEALTIFTSLLIWATVVTVSLTLKRHRLRWSLLGATFVVCVALPFVSFAQGSPEVMVTLVRVQNSQSQGVESEILLVDRENKETNFHFTDKNGVARPNKKCSRFDRLVARSTDRIWQSTESRAYCDKELLLRVAYAPLSSLVDDGGNWVAQGGDSLNQRYSRLAQISKDNVGKLQVAWTFSTGALRGHEGGPLVIGNTLYLHTPFPNKVFAIDLETQRIKWKYLPKQDSQLIPMVGADPINGGLAYAEGKIFLQQADSNLVALDAKTGELIWSVINGDPKTGAVNINAPRVFKDKVVTGISGGELGVRGFIAAYNVSDGKLAWKGYSNGPDADMLIDPKKTMTWADGAMRPVGEDSSLKTWKGDQWKIGGGTTPGVYSFDPNLNLLYYGSDGPGTWNSAQRPGDNKWSASIWARDMDTGVVRWVYQLTPNDEWGFGAANEPILATINVKSRARKALVQFNSSGFAYTLDRETGEVLVAEKYAPGTNWATNIDRRTGRPQVVAKYSTAQDGADIGAKGICPATTGAKDRQPAAFDPKTGLFYVPMGNMCMDVETFVAEYTAGQPYIGATLSQYPAPGYGNASGSFVVWDAGTGKIVEAKRERFPIWSGALVTAGGVACYGTLEGYLKCVDSGDLSKELFKFKTPSGIIGNVNTWEYNGKQYIGVLSGIGGWAGIGMAAGLEKETDGLGAVGGYRELRNYTDLGGSLTVFALPNQ